MKRAIRILIALALCFCMSIALADTYYVKSGGSLSLRDENTNEVLTLIPAGTALEPVADKCTDLCAYVTYGGYSGLVLWNYLTRTPPGGTAAQTPAAVQPAPVAAPTQAPTEGPMTLRTVNAVIQRANSKNKAEGAETTEMTVTASDNVIITAKVPRGKKIEYWVINGVRYDFLRTVSSFRLTAFDRSWTFEVVFKKTDATTLHSEAAIQAARTGQALLCKTVNGEFCHIKEGTKGGGGWIKEFDFTNDYNNRATGVLERGGQITVKVRATIPKGRNVIGWKFDETEIYPVGTAIKQFVVNRLDTSMTYEPIFGKAAVTNPPVTNPPNPVTRYVTVRCIKCRFSGGGYSNATSGSVPVGTTITITANENSSEVYWYINNTNIGMKGRTIKRTINVDTTIEAFPVIN